MKGTGGPRATVCVQQGRVCVGEQQDKLGEQVQAGEGVQCPGRRHGCAHRGHQAGCVAIAIKLE